MNWILLALDARACLDARFGPGTPYSGLMDALNELEHRLQLDAGAAEEDERAQFDRRAEGASGTASGSAACNAWNPCAETPAGQAVRIRSGG